MTGWPNGQRLTRRAGRDWLHPPLSHQLLPGELFCIVDCCLACGPIPQSEGALRTVIFYK